MATQRQKERTGTQPAGEPAWPAVSAALSDGAVAVEVLPVDPGAGERCLKAVGAGVGEWLGALVLHTGGVLLDHGWLRVHGAGCPQRRLPALSDVDAGPAAGGTPLLVGADVLGGRYALRGDADPLPGKPGEVCYLGPDTLRWEPLEWSYSDWLSVMVGGAVGDFYHDLRWPGWEADVAAVPLDQLLSLYPPVYTREGRAAIGEAERTAVPAAELYGLLDELTTA